MRNPRCEVMPSATRLHARTGWLRMGRFRVQHACGWLAAEGRVQRCICQAAQGVSLTRQQPSLEHMVDLTWIGDIKRIQTSMWWMAQHSHDQLVVLCMQALVSLDRILGLSFICEGLPPVMLGMQVVLSVEAIYIVSVCCEESSSLIPCGAKACASHNCCDGAGLPSSAHC